MNPFVVFKQNLLVAFILLLQFIAPAVIAVLLLPALCEVLGYRFEEQYVILQVLVAVLADALPERTEHAIEGLDTVRGGGLGERGQRQRSHRPTLPLGVGEPRRDDVDHLF